VRLLFDQNISHRLVESLVDLHAGSTHVRNVGLKEADDRTIWTYAIEHGYTIVSKDSDFPERALVEGAPPKAVWIQLGNCSTDEIETLLRAQHAEIDAFAVDAGGALLTLS
jgi:predicted nuclease of predicted toxin-antitoxin system